MQKKRWIIIIVLIALAALFCYSGRFRTYSTQDAFRKDGGRMFVQIPDEAAQCRFLQRRLPLSKLYLYAFTLPDDAAAQFESDLTAHYNLNQTDPVQSSAAYWFGKTAGECAEAENELDAFPLYLPFSRITERDIAQAEVLVYYPKGSGSRSFAVLKFPDAQEYICFESLTR